MGKIGRILRVIGNVGLILLAIYGIVVASLGYMSTGDYKYILLDILCIGGLVRTGYDIAKDLAMKYEKTIPGITTNLVLRGALLALGIIIVMSIVGGWQIPYPHNYGLLTVTVFITLCVLYDMISDIFEYLRAAREQALASILKTSSTGGSVRETTAPPPMTTAYLRKSKYWNVRGVTTVLAAATIVLATALAVITVSTVLAVHVKLTITYNGSPVDGKLYYYDGALKSVDIKNGTVEFDVSKLPTNITVVRGDQDSVRPKGYYYILTITGNGTVELTTLPYTGRMVVHGVDVSGIIIKNVRLPITVFKDRNFTFYFNTSVTFVLPGSVFGLPAGLYNLKEVNVTGSVMYNDTTRELTFTGNGEAEITYEPASIAGIPVLYIVAALIGIVVIAILLTRRGTVALTKSTGKSYFKLARS